MSRTPLEWHSSPKAQALIGLIAAAGHMPQTRPVRDSISSARAPSFHDERFYDCPEYAELAGMQQEAIEASFRAGLADKANMPAWDELRQQCLATLITSEIARRGLQVAA